ncbi:hypothetical protein SAMN05216436_11212 [bacterium A37T11]|nr:hypothetical protein SAMN05216436_11212 [bacterium A37T11]
MKSAQLTQIIGQDKMTTRELVFSVLAILMALLFLLVGIEKLWDYAKFRDGLKGASIIPEILAPVLARLLGGGMVMIAVSLFAGFWYPRWMNRGLWAYLGLMTLFTFYLLLVVTVFKDDQPCRCLGIYELWSLSWLQHFWLDVGITMVVLVTIGLYYLYIIYAWLYVQTVRFQKYLLQQIERKPEAL